MKTIFTLTLMLALFTAQAQLVVTNKSIFRTADQMLLANELFQSGEPFAEELGYNLDDLDPMLPNLPDSIAYTTGIEGYEYSRYLLGSVISRSGIGLSMMWSPMIKQMAAMEPASFDGMFTGGMQNGFKEDDEMMMMVGHFSMLAHQMAPKNPFPQFADFESGDPQLPQAVAPDFAMDFSTLRWDRSKMDKTLNPAAMGQSLWKQYYWAKDMLSAFHDSLNNTIEADGIISPDSVGSPHFDPKNNVFFGGNNLDGFIGQVLTAESVNKVMFLLTSLAYDGTSLGMVDAATYNPANGVKYFPHHVAVTEGSVDPMLPPRATGFSVTDPSSDLYDQLSLLLGTVSFKNMMDPAINDPAHLAYHKVFDGDPFPAAMSQSGSMGAYDIMVGASMVIFQNIMAMHYNSTEGTFVDVANLNGGSIVMDKKISARNADLIIVALAKMATEFSETQLGNMALSALDAQALYIVTKFKDASGGFYNSVTIGAANDATAKKAETQAAIAQGLYVAYQATGKQSYLTAADEAYNYLIANFNVPAKHAFKTEAGNNLATYNPETLAILAGGLREAAITGKHLEAASIYTRFSKTIINPMLLAEAEVTGENGNDSDKDGIPYIVGGNLPTVFAAEGTYSFIVTSVNNPFSSSESSLNIYPNPVISNAKIEFSNLENMNSRLSVFNITGEEVAVIPVNKQVTGKNAVLWNTENLKNGIYFVRLTNNTETLTKKIIVSR